MSYVDWDYGDDTVEDVLKAFDEYGETTVLDEYKDHIELIVATYRYESYEGDAFVVYRDRRDGKIYETSGSHCSCYGLERQWQPEEVVISEILKRPRYVYDWSDDLNRNRNIKIRAALESALGGVV